MRVGLDNDSESCVAADTLEITVLPRPRVEIQLSETEGCDELRSAVLRYETKAQPTSGSSLTAAWLRASFDNLDIATGIHPFTLTATG